MRKFFKPKLLIISIILLSSCELSEISGAGEYFDVIKVVDGDTFQINDEYNSYVRLLGIDTPEKLSEYGPGEPFANEAYEYTRKYLLKKRVKLEFEDEKYDSYGRLLAYVYSDEIFINQELLEQGLARSFILQDQLKYKKELLDSENKAKKFKRGIWSSTGNFHYPSGNKEFLIKSLNSRDFIDQRVIVRGKIIESKQNTKVISLNLENDLNIVIFKDNFENFTHFGIDPVDFYTGTFVEAIGRISIYRGMPQIAVHHPVSLRKLE